MILRTVFFDAAGTLFEAREPIGVTYARIARRHGVEADAATVSAGFRRAFHGAPGLAFGPAIAPAELRRREREWWRERVRETFAGLGRFADFDAYFDELFAYFGEAEHWSAMPDARSLLGALREGGLQLGVISNFDHRLYGILEGLDLSRYFDSITISSEAGWAKPSTELFNAALRTHRTAPEEALHVGDSEELDVQGATAAGMAAVLYDPEHAAPPALQGRVARVGRLSGVIDVIAPATFP